MARGQKTFIRSTILGEFKRLCLSLDLDPIALMQRASIDRRFLDDPDLTVSMRAVAELFEIAAHASGIEDFGLRLAEIRGLPDLGPITLMLREENTLRDALGTFVALMHLHSDAAYLHLEEGNDPIFTIDIMMEGTSHCRQAIDGSVASTTSILRWLLGEHWSPVSVTFVHSRPTSTARYERFFRCPIDFLCEFNGIVLRREDLDKKLPASSPAMRRQVERFIRTIDVAPSDTYVHRVTQLIAVALPNGEARAEIIAKLLGTDQRTLHRRLSRAGVNYSAVLENVRRNMVTRYMLDSNRPLSDIAGLVGFGSLSAFSTWFRHSFDSAPSVWRRMNG